MKCDFRIKTEYNFQMIVLIVNYEKNMNSSFVCISILIKSKLPMNCLINHLNEVSSQSLRS